MQANRRRVFKHKQVVAFGYLRADSEGPRSFSIDDKYGRVLFYFPLSESKKFLRIGSRCSFEGR